MSFTSKLFTLFTKSDSSVQFCSPIIQPKNGLIVQKNKSLADIIFKKNDKFELFNNFITLDTGL